MQDFSISSFLETHLWDDETFILGCSTWADSMFLLHHILKTPYKNNLIVAHFNHHTRCECENEEEFLRDFCKKENIKFESWWYDFSTPSDGPSKSFEELAREKRYIYFRELKKKHNAEKIFLAHHFDDRVETMIFNLLRGTKLTWLINMREIQGDIYRPLIHLKKIDIIYYLESENIVYYEDRSNGCNDYTRNYIRNEVISRFENVHPEYRRNISHLLDYLESIDNCLTKQVDNFLWWKDSFSLWSFLVQEALIQNEAIKYLYKKHNNNSTIWLSEWNIAEVQKFLRWKNNKTTKEIHWLWLKKDWDIISVYSVEKVS